MAARTTKKKKRPPGLEEEIRLRQRADELIAGVRAAIVETERLLSVSRDLSRRVANR